MASVNSFLQVDFDPHLLCQVMDVGFPRKPMDVVTVFHSGNETVEIPVETYRLWMTTAVQEPKKMPLYKASTDSLRDKGWDEEGIFKVFKQSTELETSVESDSEPVFFAFFRNDVHWNFDAKDLIAGACWDTHSGNDVGNSDEKYLADTVATNAANVSIPIENPKIDPKLMIREIDPKLNDKI